MNAKDCLDLLNQCLTYAQESPPTSLEELSKDRDLISNCIECIADVLCEIGLEETSEPNALGLKLEEAIDFLLSMLYQLDENEA